MVRRVTGPCSRTVRSAPYLATILLVILSFFASATAEAESRTYEQRPQWVSPVVGMEILEPFDAPEEIWSAGHRGIDISALPDEPLRAPDSGTIRFNSRVAGQLTVSIETDSGYIVSFQPVAGRLGRGAAFAAGEEIGTVTEGDHCKNSCIHVGVWPVGADHAYVDPAGFFEQAESILLPLSRIPAEEHTGDDSTSGAGAWDGHTNGRIPASALCELKSAPGQMLRCDAASAFDRMSHAFEIRFGRPISVTDSYRDYATQVILKKRKGRMAATPGRSNHGWALAVDLGGGINNFGSVEHQWMRAHGPTFGWVHPSWARQTGSLPEPWHWEFRK